MQMQEGLPNTIWIREYVVPTIQKSTILLMSSLGDEASHFCILTTTSSYNLYRARKMKIIEWMILGL